MYCTICGRECKFSNTKELNFYYDTLTCYPDCHTVSNGNREPKYDITYKRWLQRLCLLSYSRFWGSYIYNPLTGEKIDDVKSYLQHTGFILDID